MPLYVYHCDTCEHDFEKMVRFSEADKPQECPNCSSASPRKHVTIFANGGFGRPSGNDGGSCSSSGGRFS